MKTYVSKEKVACPRRVVREVNDNADMQFLNFAIEYFCKSKNVHETVFVSSYGAQVESFKQKKVKNLVTLSL